MSLVYIAITAVGQNSIPNGDFETWNSATYDNPQNYPYTSNYDVFFRYHYQFPFNAVKTTDAYHGGYAIQLTTDGSAAQTAFGYFININPENGDPNTWTGGMPYSQMPTGIRGYYKYNVATGDSATILATFSKAGSNIGTYIFNVGEVHTDYTPFNFTFFPPLPEAPDSVIFAAISSNIFVTQNGVAGSVLILDSVSFTGVTSQPALMNGDFESWESQTLYMPADWYSQYSQGDVISRTTDAYAGDYAIELKTFLGNNNNGPAAQPGMISTGYYPDNCTDNCIEHGGYPFSNQIDTLAFWYKYSPSADDSAVITLNLKKNGSNIHWTGTYLHAAETYQYKEVPFNAWQTPDTVIVQLMSTTWQNNAISFVGSDLKIDEMHFKSQLNTGIKNYKNDNSISISPNPSNGKFQLAVSGSQFAKNYNVEIYNIRGEEIYKSQIRNPKSEIDLSTQPGGIYFIKIHNGQTVLSKKIVIQ